MLRSFFGFVVLLGSISFVSPVFSDLIEVDCIEVPDSPLGNMERLDANGAIIPAVGSSFNSVDGVVLTARANTNDTNFTDIVVNPQTGQVAGNNVLDNVRGGSRRVSFNSLETQGVIPGTTGNFTNNDAQFCMWISPDATGGDQMVFETGGSGDGSAIVLVGNPTAANPQFDLSLGVKNGTISSAVTIDLLSIYNSTPDFTDFLKVTSTIDLTNDTITIAAENLGTGLTVTSSATYTGNDWAGGDSSSLFQTQGSVGDAALIPLRNGGGWSNFDGQFAGMKVYAVPEPGSVWLIAFAATGLTLRRRKR